MKTINKNRFRFCARPYLVIAVLWWAGSAQAEDEPQAAAEQPEPQPLPQPQPPQPPQLVPQPGPQQRPPVPPDHQPTTGSWPVEVRARAEKMLSWLSWYELPLSISIEHRTTWPQNSATRRLVGRDTAISTGVSVGYDVFKLTDKLTAKVDLGWALLRDMNVSSSSLDEEELRTRLVTLGLSLRFHLFPWLAPYARLAGGIGWDSLTVGGDTGEWRDKQYFAHGSAGGGITLRSPSVSFWPTRFPWLGLGLTLSIEGGYYLAPDVRLSLKAAPDPNIEKPIPTAAVPIGEMGRSAPYLRVTIGMAL